jgi:Pectate lyase superfamily protein
MTNDRRSIQDDARSVARRDFVRSVALAAASLAAGGAINPAAAGQPSKTPGQVRRFIRRGPAGVGGLNGVPEGWVNVKNFGAVGNGVADDRRAIQAAFNANKGGGIVYFPPGHYRITGPISLNDIGASSSRFLLTGGNAAVITGDFPDFLLKRNGGFDAPGQHIIERLLLINNHQQGGCVLSRNTIGVTVQNCYIRGNIGIQFEEGSLSQAVRDCYFNGVDIDYNLGLGPQANSTSIGILIRGNFGLVENCDFNGWHKCVVGYQGLAMRGCRVETSHFGVVVGESPDGGTYPCSGSIADTSMDGCGVGIHVRHAVQFTIERVGIQGETFCPKVGGGIETGRAGILVDFAQGLKLSNVGVSDVFAEASINLNGQGNPIWGGIFELVEALNSQGNGVRWIMPPSASQVTFTHCNQP